MEALIKSSISVHIFDNWVSSFFQAHCFAFCTDNHEEQSNDSSYILYIYDSLGACLFTFTIIIIIIIIITIIIIIVIIMQNTHTFHYKI